MPVRSTLRSFLHLLTRLLLPEACHVCGRRLQAEDEVVCAACFAGLPFTRMRGERGNVVERLFWGRLPVVRANAYLHYVSGAASGQPLLRLKYGRQPQIGTYFGRTMAADLLDTDFFRDIDCIIPVPLAKERLHERGYNQSEQLARGVAERTGLTVRTDIVERVVSNPTQTSLNAAERAANVKGIFRLVRPDAVSGRHVLLIDDVLTTGATLLSCGEELTKAEGVRISILVLSLAGTHTAADVPPTNPNN